MPPTPVAVPPAGQQQPGGNAGRPRQEGPMAAVTAGLRLAEQVLFVFVASLWPNALGGGEPLPPEMMNHAVPPPPPPPLPLPPPQQNRRRNNGDDSGDEEGADGRVREGQERVNVVVQ